jgi:adenine-specific DNA-methyltransferase
LVPIAKRARVYRRDNLTSQRPAQAGDLRSYEFEGREYRPGKGTFKTDKQGLERLQHSERLEAYGETLGLMADFPPSLGQAALPRAI